jgi:uncharacterized membrane protein YraQ (UPF0718 family)
MPGTVIRLSFSLVSVFLLSFFLVLLMNPQVLQTLPVMEHPDLQTFKTMFVSITLEAFPFILLGVLVSSVIQVFVPETFIRRLIPRNPVLGVLVASLLGIVFPVCECGMVPVARRLILKGFPLYAAVVFLLAGPIVNPVVYSATFMAFRSNPSITYSRMGLALVVATLAGLAVYRFVRRNPMKHEPVEHHHQHSHAHEHDHRRSGSRIVETFDHASGEFFDMGKYLIFGAFLTAIVQTFVPRTLMVDIAQSDWAANAFMMGFAYIISICSTSDAFVASSFATTFSASSLLAFLVFGPMLDLKSTLMLLSVFKARFVLFLAVLVAVLVWLGSYAFGMLIK